MKAKEGMRLARKEGFKISHIKREARDIKEFDLWYWFARRGQEFIDSKIRSQIMLKRLRISLKMSS